MTDDKQPDGQTDSEENRREAIAPGVWVDPEQFDDSEIAAIQRVTVSDRELVSIPADLAKRCRGIAEFDRRDLRFEQVLAQCAEYGSLHYEDALDLYQRVEMPDPTLDAQAIVDGAYGSELPLAYCPNCGGGAPADKKGERWECWKCGTRHEGPPEPPNDEELARGGGEEQ